MEKKSMGELIAILRKTKGLTQRELADMLNVSDKAVSRWERSESYPDIELIPNIAKIFSISTDELIKGELFDAKSETSKKSSLSSFRTMSLISIMLSILGIIVAAIINIGLFRCYIAFYASLVFYVAAIFIEIIATNNALGEIDDENKIRKTIRFGLKSISLPILLASFSLPLLSTGNSMVALKGESWLIQGALCLLIGVVILSLVSFALSKLLIDKGIYPLNESEKETYLARRRRLKANIAIVVIVIMFLSAILNIGIIATPYGGTKFYDYESFGEYMAKREKRSTSSYYSPANMVSLPVEEIIGITYYDRDGNIITEEEAMKRHILDRDGNVVYEYYEYNENVASVTYSPSEEDSLPIIVRTYDDLRAKNKRDTLVIAIFSFIYAFEALFSIFAYFKLRAKNNKK